MKYYLLGAAAGFAYFVYQTSLVKDVCNRQKSDGTTELNIKGIIPYLKAPFENNPLFVPSLSEVKNLSRNEIIGRAKLLKLNWVATTVVGSLIFGVACPYFF